ncbi:MAG: DUF4290 domain-containing protein [Prevotellaceae bacterium]|jgi:hypothetical protein|nr:DUF4290 domain-containing protein [Prevotellaceae bacterium]
MDYNTQRKKLILPEYGRSIHKMVDWVSTISDRDERNRQIRAVIAVMGNMNPHLRDVNDFKHKLWDHVQIMSDFRIDIDSPFPTPTRESFNADMNRVPYKTDPIRIRHYGRNIQMMINDVARKSDSEAKDKALIMLANHMKKLYVTWNKDVVHDDIIFRDIEFLSKGRIKVPEGTKLSQAYNLNVAAATSKISQKGKQAQPQPQPAKKKKK